MAEGAVQRVRVSSRVSGWQAPDVGFTKAGVGMIKIWCVEADGSRELVRDDVVDEQHAARLVEQGNHGARLRGLGHRYEAEKPVAKETEAVSDASQVLVKEAEATR